MLKILKTGLALAMSFLTVACSSGVGCDVVAYHTLGAPQGETVRIVHQDPAITGTPEFNYFASQIRRRLNQLGYRQTGNGTANLIFAIKYDFGEGPAEVARLPKCFTEYRYVFDEYGSPYYRGLECYTTQVELQSRYIYFLELKIYSPIEPGDPGEVIYEGMVHSVSLNDNMAQMMPYLIAALFTDFPGESGEVRRVVVDGNSNRKQTP